MKTKDGVRDILHTKQHGLLPMDQLTTTFTVELGGPRRERPKHQYLSLYKTSPRLAPLEPQNTSLHWRQDRSSWGLWRRERGSWRRERGLWRHFLAPSTKERASLGLGQHSSATKTRQTQSTSSEEATFVCTYGYRYIYMCMFSGLFGSYFYLCLWHVVMLPAALCSVYIVYIQVFCGREWYFLQRNYTPRGVCDFYLCHRCCSISSTIMSAFRYFNVQRIVRVSIANNWRRNSSTQKKNMLSNAACKDEYRP